MEKKQFQSESKRLLELMINSIYTHKEIFLRELISNASDAIDKVYYKSLTDESIKFNKDDFYIKLSTDKNERILSIHDMGIGMNDEELEKNLGIIANSGSFAFKKDNELKDGYDIIGQFGVGFYSAFMVAKKVVVTTKPFGYNQAFRWESDGSDGYTVEKCEFDGKGTLIEVYLKDNTQDENYDEYIDTYRLKSIIKKYSDFVRYPIKLDMEESVKKENSDDYEEIIVEKTLNSMVPLWRRNKNELTQEDYESFYHDKHFGYDKPLRHMHISVDGAFSYNAILYLPERTPYDFYTKEYEKGLELYSSGVMIMQKSKVLIDDYFGFVKGIVDSEDLNLNISREMLQHDRQLSAIAKNLRSKIKNELLNMMQNDKESYEKFFDSFGRVLKYGMYDNYGKDKDFLKELIMFKSSFNDGYTTLKDYVSRMKEDQKYIYYVVGQNIDKMKRMPQTELILEKEYEILFFMDEIDEFAIKVLENFETKEFRSVSNSDLGIDNENTELMELNKELITSVEEQLKGKISKVIISNKLKNHPVCLSSQGELSIEMERVLSMMPDSNGLQASKVLEINPNHTMFNSLKNTYENDMEKFQLYVDILFNQALLIEGLSIEDPIDFANKIGKLMI